MGWGQKVISLDAHRRRRDQYPPRAVIYLSEGEASLTLLQSLGFLKVTSIQDALGLEKYAGTPDLILIESHLTWADPVRLVGSLQNRFRVPIVMCCDPTPKGNRLIKKAFAAGCSDTLFTPLRKDELSESLGVLLKFQTQALFHH